MTLVYVHLPRRRYLSWWIGRMLLVGAAWKRHSDGIESIAVYVGPLALEYGWPWQKEAA